VISSTRNPVFAKQKLCLSHSRGLAVPCVLLAIFVACIPWPSRADSLEDAARALALKVCASGRQPALEIHWQDPSPAQGALSDGLRNAFLSQLSACGIETTKKLGAPLLSVSLQWTASKVLLMADSGNSTEPRRVEMVELARPALSLSNQVSPAPHLTRELIWLQEKPINSAEEWYDRSDQQHFLFLLSDGRFVRMRSENGGWTLLDSTDLLANGRRIRGGEGALTYVSDPQIHPGVLVGGKLCDVEFAGRVSFACRNTDLGKKVVILASNCEETPQILVTGLGDYTERDRITLAGPEVLRAPMTEDEIRTHSVEMPGPVLGMSDSEDVKAVAAVVRNLSTGMYEVYRITAVCGN
jgi:hypothetical protein